MGDAAAALSALDARVDELVFGSANDDGAGDRGVARSVGRVCAASDSAVAGAGRAVVRAAAGAGQAVDGFASTDASLARSARRVVVVE